MRVYISFLQFDPFIAIYFDGWVNGRTVYLFIPFIVRQRYTVLAFPESLPEPHTRC